MQNKMIKGILISCVLSYFFIKTDDTLTRIVLCPFIVYGVAFSLTQIFIMCGKKSAALKFKKIYEVAFFVYLFVCKIFSVLMALVCILSILLFIGTFFDNGGGGFLDLTSLVQAIGIITAVWSGLFAYFIGKFGWSKK